MYVRWCMVVSIFSTATKPHFPANHVPFEFLVGNFSFVLFRMRCDRLYQCVRCRESVCVSGSLYFARLSALTWISCRMHASLQTVTKIMASCAHIWWHRKNYNVKIMIYFSWIPIIMCVFHPNHTIRLSFNELNIELCNAHVDQSTYVPTNIWHKIHSDVAFSLISMRSNVPSHSCN